MSHRDEGITFSGLDHNETYVALIARVYEQAFISVSLKEQRPRPPLQPNAAQQAPNKVLAQGPAFSVISGPFRQCLGLAQESPNLKDEMISKKEYLKGDLLKTEKQGGKQVSTHCEIIIKDINFRVKCSYEAKTEKDVKGRPVIFKAEQEVNINATLNRNNDALRTIREDLQAKEKELRSTSEILIGRSTKLTLSPKL